MLESHVRNASPILNLADTLVHDPLVLGGDHNVNSMREMWNGRKSPNCDSCREALVKVAMYGNFVSKLSRTSPTEVAAQCT